MRKVLAVAGATAVMALAAPPAHAQPVDAAGCTTDFVDAMNGPWIVPTPNVTYTPPATINVDGNPTINFARAFANYTLNATVTYVNCVV